MKGKVTLIVALFGMISIPIFGQTVILKNDTNNYTSAHGNPTPIEFKIVNRLGNTLKTNDKLNNMILSPGQEITINTDELPALDSGERLLVNYNAYYDKLLVGFDNLREPSMGITKYQTYGTSDPNLFRITVFNMTID